MICWKMPLILLLNCSVCNNMKSRRATIEIVKATTMDITIVDSNNTDISDANEIFFVVTNDPYQSDVLIKKEANRDASDLVNGKIVFKIEKSDTKDLSAGSFIYEVVISWSDDREVVPLVGDFYIQERAWIKS